MNILLEGDKSRAICEHCASVVPTTFLRRNVPFSDGSGVASNVLVGVCDVCGRVVAIPAQSTPAIARARKQPLESVEANLPAVYLDVLDCAAHAIDKHASTQFRRLLISYFVHKAVSDKRAPARLRRAHERAMATFPESRGVARRRLSVKLPPPVGQALRRLEAETALNRTELLKSVVYEIQDTVLAQPRAMLIEELRTLSAVAG